MRTVAAVLYLLLVLAGRAAAAVPDHAVVFMYHRFGDDRYPSTNITLDQFDAQLDYLSAHHYRVWPLDRIVRTLRKGGQLPDHTVALTIDDAYQSVYENAWPRLRARGWPFTVFVSTDAVDRHLPDFMSWKEMRQMAAGGATFANHSSTHDYLVHRKADESDAAWRSRVKFDIEHAGKRLQTELGGAVTANPRLFAYPYGEYDEALAGLVREMGFVAFGQESGAIGPESDPRLMPRFPMAEHFAGMSQFITKAQSLPLVVSKQQPWDPTDARRHNPPELMLTVTSPGADLDRLACYYKGRRMQIDWLDRAAGRFRIRATSPVPPPRDRYNCTAPNAQQRYYWFSHLWIPVPAVPDSRPSDTKD